MDDVLGVEHWSVVALLGFYGAAEVVALVPSMRRMSLTALCVGGAFLSAFVVTTALVNQCAAAAVVGFFAFFHATGAANERVTQ